MTTSVQAERKTTKYGRGRNGFDWATPFDAFSPYRRPSALEDVEELFIYLLFLIPTLRQDISGIINKTE